MPDYLSFAKKLALKAGDIMLEHFQIGMISEKKEDNTPLTIADTAVNRLVIEEVAKHYPDHGVRGEEESTQQDHHEYVWVCDPIDGTVPYTHGIPTNLFSLALTRGGVPIVAVLYDPYMKRMYYAEKNKGAFMNETRLHVNKAHLTQGISAGLDSGMRNLNTIDFHSALRNKGLRVFAHHCVTYTAMLVATGQFVSHVHAGGHSHDIAAVKLVVEEAGGKVTDLDGNEQRYDQSINGAVISNGIVHDELLELIKPFLKKGAKVG